LQKTYDDTGRVIEEFKGRPEHPLYQQALQNQAQVKQEMRKLGAEAAKPELKYLDPRTEARNKEYGKNEGAALVKERTAFSNMQGANAKVMGQLDMLEKAYSDPNVPQGELGPYIHVLKSGFKSLGVDNMGGTTAGDIARAVSTSLALSARTADGVNLLPGAMSNYEDQLLQKMAPTLSMTQEGRMALIQIMRQIAQSHLRMADEATQFAKANGNALTPAWYASKERAAYEEMMKLKRTQARVSKQFGIQ
jgi:hypothetical protein